MAEYRWAVESRNGTPEWKDRFVYGHVAPHDVEPGLSDNAEFRQIRVVLPRAPNPRTERYSGTPANPFRAATVAEMATYDAAQQNQEVDREVNIRVMRALTRATFELKTQPWTLAQYRARVRELFKQDE